jgi:predicted secreted protein
LAAVLSCLAAGQAPAKDQALIDFIGYSRDFRYFAFEEYGIRDGSGSAFSTIYVIDLAADSWAPGSPFRAEGHEDDKTLAEIRHEALNTAAAAMRDLQIDTPAQIAALSGDGVPGPATEIRFGFPGSGDSGSTAGAYTLRLETFRMPQTPACTEALGTAGMGFALSIATEGSTREFHRDTVLPQSRNCPTGYGLYAVVFPYGDGEIERAVAIVQSYPVGWEGADRRFLAVPIGK